MKRRARTTISGAVAAAALLLAIVLPITPALACSCALVTTEELAQSADFAFIGSEIGRLDTRSRDFESILVTFSVDEWLSHEDGPPEFQAFTGQGGGDCGVGPVTGRVAVFAYGTHARASVNSCGSIQPAQDAVADFEGRVVPAYPVAFDDTPDDPGSRGSYSDLALPVVGGAAVLGAIAFGVVAIRRRQDDGIE